MKQEDINILNFENKLQQDRRELNDLIFYCQTQGDNRELISDKLQNMQRELEYMENQFRMLRQSVADVKPVTDTMQPQLIQQQPVQPQALQPQMTQAQPIQPQPIQPQPVQPQALQPQTMQAQLTQPQPIQPQPVQPQALQPQTMQPQMTQAQPIQPQPVNNARKKENDLEKTFGKSWMGVIASGLVFISFIIFASMLLPVLTDGMKIALMFMVSFAFTIVGLVKLRADNENKFYLALSGCGVGAIYISILVSGIYFKAFGDIAMYALIFIWAVFVCYFGRGRNVIFEIIGQLGITIAVMFGAVVVVIDSDEIRLMMMVMFFAVTSIIFMFAHRHKELNKNGISLSFNTFNICVIATVLALFPDSGITRAVSVALIVYSALQIAFSYMCDMSENGFGFGMINIAYMVIGIGLFNILLRNTPPELNIVNIAGLAVCAVLLVLMEARFGKCKVFGSIMVQCVAMIIMLFLVAGMQGICRTVFVTLLMLVYVCAGFYRKNCYYQFGSLVYMIYFMLCYDNPEKMLCGFVYFGLALFLWRKEHNLSFGLTAYCIFLIKLMMDCTYITSLFGGNNDMALLFGCIVTSGINLALIYINKNKQQKNCVMFTFYTIHILEMFIILFEIIDAPWEYSYLISIPWALVLFVSNTKSMLAQNKENAAAGIYTGFKFTVLLLAVHLSFDASGVIVSICHFVLAVICITLGFWIEHKSLRIYGLVLSMISVFKMLLIDMVYSSLGQLAAGFFVAGILCFAISRIYNMIDSRSDKLLKNKTEDKNV